MAPGSAAPITDQGRRGRAPKPASSGLCPGNSSPREDAGRWVPGLGPRSPAAACVRRECVSHSCSVPSWVCESALLSISHLQPWKGERSAAGPVAFWRKRFIGSDLRVCQPPTCSRSLACLTWSQPWGSSPTGRNWGLRLVPPVTQVPGNQGPSWTPTLMLAAKPPVSNRHPTPLSPRHLPLDNTWCRALCSAPPARVHPLPLPPPPGALSSWPRGSQASPPQPGSQQGPVGGAVVRGSCVLSPSC